MVRRSGVESGNDRYASNFEAVGQDRKWAERGRTIAKYCGHFNDRNAPRTGRWRWVYSSGEPSPLLVLAPELPGACNGCAFGHIGYRSFRTRGRMICLLTPHNEAMR
jgi:hypothetical protein